MTQLNTSTKAMCIYCYKSSATTPNIEHRNSSETHKQFINLISRHLKDGKIIEILDKCEYLPEACHDCLEILTNFCELYHQLKCLELHLNWQVDKLWNVMRWADRVPSRIKECRNTDDFERKFEFRKILKENCERHFAQQSPRVSLSLPFSGQTKIETSMGTPFVRDQQSGRSEDEFSEMSISNSNHNDQEEKHVSIQEEVSPFVSNTEFTFSNSETDVKSQYEAHTTTIKGPTLVRIKSESPSLESAVPPVAPTQSSNTPNTEIADVNVTLISTFSPHPPSNDPVLPSSSSSFPSQKRVLPQEEHAEERKFLTRRSLRIKLQCSNCKRTFSDQNRFEAHNSLCSQSTDTDSETSDTEDESEIDVKVKSEIEISSSKMLTNVGSMNDNNRESFPHTSTTSSSSSDEDDDNSVKAKGNHQKSFKHKLYSCSKCIPPTLHNSQIHEIYKHSNGQSRLNARGVHLLNLTLNSLKLNVTSLETQYQCTLDPDRCTKKYPLSEELENHIKLHGKFTCPICDLCCTKALDLITHELEHSNEKQLSLDKSFKKGEIFHCARCDYKTGLKADINNHYLKEHFGLSEIQAKCPICQQTFSNFDTVPLTHYINNHDLNRLDDPEEILKCSELDCHAYFLTEDQLHVHWNREHCSLKVKHFQKEKDITIKIYNYKQKLKKKSILCPYCPKKFLHQTFLRSHILAQHVKDAGFQDAEVKKGERIITKDGLTVDDIVLEKGAKYFCKLNSCKEKFRNEEDFQSHLKLHGEFPCNFCESVSTFAMDLAVHEMVHVQNVTEFKSPNKCQRIKFRCSRCPFVTGWKEKYLDHFVRHHLGLILDKKKCPICRHAFSIYCGVSTLKIHSFRRRLYRHCIEWHDFTGVEDGEDGAFKCDKCLAYFRTNIQLLQHTEEIHDSMCHNNSCNECGKNFKNIKSLGEHRRKVHKVELKHACSVPECGKKFETLRELVYHSNHVHFGDTTGERTFSCEDCENKYFTRIALIAHTKTHTNERATHVCEQCGKSFKDKTRLENHYKFHEGPKSWDFACEVCGKKIFSQQKLMEHMRVHTKEKPFVCQVCGVAYGHRHNLRIHVNSKHKEIQDVPRKCTTTNFASSRKGKKLK